MPYRPRVPQKRRQSDEERIAASKTGENLGLSGFARGAWLDPDLTDAKEAAALARKSTVQDVEFHPVSARARQ